MPDIQRKELERLKLILKEFHSKGSIPHELVEELNTEEKEFLFQIISEERVKDTLAFIDSIDEKQDWNIVKVRMDEKRAPKIPVWKPLLKYAAMFIMVLGCSFFVYHYFLSGANLKIDNESIRLKVGDDFVKVIKEGERRQIVTSSGLVIGKQEGNKISYNQPSGIDELVFNELEIPYGKIFDLELSDGTVVHLNSGTQIKYPVKFLRGHQREVFIKGEAYFKVAKDKVHPFIVSANDIAIEVLGTEFNVSSYQEDRHIKTVLVEGSVQLTNSVTIKDTIVLKPNQGALWDKETLEAEVKNVDVDLYTSWINGEMVFRNTSFESMVKKLERKYNVVIENNNTELAHKELNARFSIDVESLEDILIALKQIVPFDYKMTQEKVMIY